MSSSDLESNESSEKAERAASGEAREVKVAELTRFGHLRRLCTAFLLIPGILAAIGATTETIVYGNLNRPNFNVVYGVYAALIAAPLITVRWYWKWPKHVQKLQLAYYGLFTAGFVVCIFLSTVAGQDAFRIGAHIRRLFDGPAHAKHSEITSIEDIHNWLNATLGTTFQDSRPHNMFSRELQGRLALLGPIRLTQFRSAVKPCNPFITRTGVIGGKQCYESRSETVAQDTQTFSSLNYTFSNPSYLSLPLKTVYASDIIIQGEQYSYPQSGHWVLFAPDYNHEMVKSMLAAMRSPEHPFIDHQTSMISVDFTVLVTDSPKTLSAVVTYVIESTGSGWFVPTPPTLAMINLDDVELGTFESLVPGQCVPIPVHRNFFTPLYFGVVPAVIYTVFVHILQARSHFAKYVRRPFTYTEVVWALCVLLAMIFRWRAISFEHCDDFVLKQPIYGTNETREVYFFEQASIATWWYESRRVLGMALFLHVFTALKFVVQLPSLGGLIRTLQLAGRELASFSLSFAVVFVAFVSMFYIIFSTDTPQYQSIAYCVGTLWLGMLGELEISPEMWKSKEWALPVVIIFTFVSVFVLLTVIVAIISDAHEAARTEKEKAQQAQQRMSALLSGWRERRARSHGSQTGVNRSQSFLRRLSFGPNGFGSRSGSAGRAGSAAGFAGVVKRAMSSPPAADAVREEDTISEEGAVVLPALTMTLGNGRATCSTTSVPEASQQDSSATDLSPSSGSQVCLLPPPSSMADRKPPGSKFGVLRGICRDGPSHLRRKSKIKPLATTPGSRNTFAATHTPLKTFSSTTVVGEGTEHIAAGRGSTSSVANAADLPSAAATNDDAV